MTTLNQVKAHRNHLKAKRHPIKVGEAQHARDSREEVYRENQLIIDSLIGEMFFTDRGRESIFTILKGLYPVDRKTESVIPSKHVIEFLRKLNMKSVEVRTKTLEDFEYEILHHKWKNRKKPPLKLFFGFLKRSEQQIESEKALNSKGRILLE